MTVYEPEGVPAFPLLPVLAPARRAVPIVRALVSQNEVNPAIAVQIPGSNPHRIRAGRVEVESANENCAGLGRWCIHEWMESSEVLSARFQRLFARSSRPDSRHRRLRCSKTGVIRSRARCQLMGDGSDFLGGRERCTLPTDENRKADTQI